MPGCPLGTSRVGLGEVEPGSGLSNQVAEVAEPLHPRRLVRFGRDRGRRLLFVLVVVHPPHLLSCVPYRMSGIHVIYDWSSPPGPFVARRGSLAAAAHGLDPERLLAAWDRWGEAVPGHLPEDVAYVLWDGHALHAARDAMGVRPLFYRWTHGGIALASDVGALLEPRPPVSDLALRHHLLGVAPPRDLTVWEGVRRL